MSEKKVYTGWQKKTADKITQTYKTDERLSLVNEKGLAACGVAAIVYVIARIIYVGIKGSLALPELILLFVMVGLIELTNLKNGVCDLPTLFGRKLDPSQEAKWRRIRLYASDSILMAVIFAVVDYILRTREADSGAIFGSVRDIVIYFIVFFILEYVISEGKVKRYNRSILKLEAEENDLDD